MSQQQLAQLRRYNPQAIADYYNKRPWLVIWRALTVIGLFVGLGIGLLLDRSIGHAEINRSARAGQLRDILTQLGPTYIKVGQALSTRPDLIKQDFLEELIKLQDQLPAFDNELAMQIIETQLKRSVEELYKEISPRPVAAASLGQVYKARLYTGEEVAVKVPAFGLATLTGAPATSSDAQILPPPCTNNPFTSKPVVTPSCTIDKSKVLGSYTKV